MKALLVGVAHYRDGAVADLPFVVDDLAEVRAALADVGVVDVETSEETGRDGILEALEAFIELAPRDEDLLILLSGHGVHRGGRDYLVPSTARTTASDFAAKCVDVDVAELVERSACGHVLVLVDAGREGIALREMAVGDAEWSKGTSSWPRPTAVRASNRVVATVFACSNAEKARYVDDAGAFSVFSRALCLVLRDPEGPTSLLGVRASLQDHVDALTREHQLPAQRVRLSGSHVDEDVELFVRSDRLRPSVDGVHPWVVAADQHPLWARHDLGGEEMRAATTDMVRALATGWERAGRAVSNDPWWDRELAERTLDRLAWLLSGVLRDLVLSDAEVALLVVLPFAHEMHRVRGRIRAAAIHPEDPGPLAAPDDDRRAFERVAAGYGRLARRAATGGPASAAIGWWLAHRWLDEATADPAVLPPASGLAAEVFAPERIAAVLRAVRRDATPGGTLDDATHIAASTARERPMRERLVASIHVLAHRLAIDPTELGDVVVDHIGVRDAVDLPTLHGTLRAAGWHATGRLRARCTHPAVDLALADHVAAVDRLLADLSRAARAEPALAPLRALPARASADLAAAIDERGEPHYTSTGTRFRLADDRVQELLMGEQLYGDPLLAVRELYQNALDACRYRACRTAFLERTGAPVAAWSGRIDFWTEDDPGGGRTLVCRDSGVGMGERELRDAFAHAGVRFTDLPEVVEERAAWERRGIHLHPNSRFGIGVLSYFMLADDLTVTTCRLGRDGRPGRQLEVSIPGPGALFRIRDTGPGAEAGTTLRLTLRAEHRDVDMIDALHSVLWVAPFRTTASKGATTETWPASELHRPGSNRPGDAIGGGAGMWWCTSGGAVLADGLMVGESLTGAVVDLAGADVPRLRVDRRAVVDLDRSEVVRRQLAAVDALFAPEVAIVSVSWIDALGGSEVADSVVAAGARAGATVGGNRPLALLGHCALDARLRMTRPGTAADGHLVAARLRSWAGAGVLPGLRSTVNPVVAHPSDVRLLMSTDVVGNTLEGDVPPDRPVHPVWLARGAARAGLDASAVAERFRAWGYTVEPAAEREAEGRTYRESDEKILRRCGGGDLLVPGAALAHPERLHVKGEHASYVLERLGAWGIVDLPNSCPPLPTSDRLLLAQWGPGGPRTGVEPELLDLSDPVPLGHIIEAAAHGNRRVDDVVARLRELGASTFEDGVEEAMEIDTPLRPGDADIVLDGDLPGWVRTPASPPSYEELVTVAATTTQSTAAVARRCAALGLLRPPSPLALDVLDALDDDDVDLVAATTLDRASPVGGGVHLATAVVAALLLARPLPVVLARLDLLGVPVSPVPLPDLNLERDDELIVSDLIEGGGGYWRHPDAAVPLAHAVLVADRLGRSPTSVLARLAELGFALVESVAPPFVHGGDDVVVAVNGRVLDPEHPVPVIHVLGAAVALAREPARIVERLRDYGYRVAHTSASLDAAAARLVTNPEVAHAHPAVPLLPGVVATLADQTGRSPRWVCDRLQEWGVAVAGDAPDDTWSQDPRLLSRRRRRGEGDDDLWLDPAVPVPTAELLAHLPVTLEPSGNLGPVVRRLHEWGFTLEDSTILADDGLAGHIPSD